jgi:hypothetical protein
LAFTEPAMAPRLFASGLPHPGIERMEERIGLVHPGHGADRDLANAAGREPYANPAAVAILRLSVSAQRPTLMPVPHSGW